MTDIVGKIIETTEKLKEEIHSLQLYEEECIGILIQLKEEHERVLTYRYLEGMDMLEVSEIMGYERQYTYELKDKALAELDEVLSRTDRI